MYREAQRVPYQELKTWALEAYYDFCRDSGLVDRWSHEHVIARVADMFDEGFERPVEDVMWRTILLILSGGWHPDWEKKARQGIADLLKEYGLENLLAGVPEKEAELFRHDLQILKLV